MKKELTIKEMARLGGLARARKMTKEERSASAKKASWTRWGKMPMIIIDRRK
jgi:hypothetical protein